MVPYRPYKKIRRKRRRAPMEAKRYYEQKKGMNGMGLGGDEVSLFSCTTKVGDRVTQVKNEK